MYMSSKGYNDVMQTNVRRAQARANKTQRSHGKIAASTERRGSKSTRRDPLFEPFARPPTFLTAEERRSSDDFLRRLDEAEAADSRRQQLELVAPETPSTTEVLG